MCIYDVCMCFKCQYIYTNMTPSFPSCVVFFPAGKNTTKTTTENDDPQKPNTETLRPNRDRQDPFITHASWCTVQGGGQKVLSRPGDGICSSLSAAHLALNFGSKLVHPRKS